jgi:hypothetical protein
VGSQIGFVEALPNKSTGPQPMNRLNQLKSQLTHKTQAMKHKVAIIGSGNWYSLTV